MTTIQKLKEKMLDWSDKLDVWLMKQSLRNLRKDFRIWARELSEVIEQMDEMKK